MVLSGHVFSELSFFFIQVVINGLYSSENNVQASFDSPVKVRHALGLNFNLNISIKMIINWLLMILKYILFNVVAFFICSP